MHQRKLQRSHVGFELIQTGETKTRAFNDHVRASNCKIISLGSNVTAGKGRILTTAYKKRLLELPNDQ